MAARLPLERDAVLKDVKVIAARRGYEYPADDLRLTILTLSPVMEAIRAAFSFQSAQVGTPVPLFGPVPQVIPPGLALNFGLVRHAGGGFTPIRLIHFEQRRIVIDVAGDSSAIDDVYAQLQEVLAGFHATVGEPVAAAPERIREYSELTATLPVDPSALLAPAVVRASTRLTASAQERTVLIPALSVRLAAPDQEYPGPSMPDPEALQLELRAGTRPGERTYYSAAPLPTDAHRAMLDELARGLAEFGDRRD